jgi:hypothetical protein
MQAEEVAMYNLCTDLVSLRKYEAFPAKLFSKQAGEWVRVREFCHQIGVAAADSTAALFATWLPDPAAHEGYAVVMFYDDESKWSMAAHYNQARLVEGMPSINAVAMPSAAVPALPHAGTGVRQ